MPRYIKNTAIVAKRETTSGVDAVPTGAANGMAVSNVSINPLNLTTVQRNLLLGAFGSSGALPAARFVEVTFDVELVGAASAGVAPAWSPLARACALAEVVSAGVRVDYTPITRNQESVTIYVEDDGLVHKLIGARGNLALPWAVNGLPLGRFRFLALDGGQSAVSLGSLDVSAWQVPQVITTDNSGDVTLGGTFSTSGAPALTGGTAYVSRGLDVDLGLSVNHVPLLGAESIDITDRVVTVRTDLDLTAAQELAQYTALIGATRQAVSLIHGTVVGRRTAVHMPSMQLTGVAKGDEQGRRLVSLSGEATITSGNDEFRLVTSF